NCIERIFGVLKKRFPILCLPNQHPYATQVKLPLALGGLYNFIIYQNGQKESEWWEHLVEEKDTNLERVGKKDRRADTMGEEEINRVDSVKDDGAMKEFRDKLAERMWIDYVNYMK
ncbi:hypothetical protein C7212DRAFT_200066, partial [Tuber magnatum]